MTDRAIIELDIHGMTKYQAKQYIDSQITKAGGGVYRLRIIHGYRGGTELREMIRKTYRTGHPKVKRVECGLNPGETDIILRELSG